MPESRLPAISGFAAVTSPGLSELVHRLVLNTTVVEGVVHLHILLALLGFFGDKNIALGMATLFAILLVVRRKQMSKSALASFTATA